MRNNKGRNTMSTNTESENADPAPPKRPVRGRNPNSGTETANPDKKQNGN